MSRSAMRALVIPHPSIAGGRLEFAERPVPEPLPGEVLVETAYGGLNFADLMMRAGTYPHPKGYPLGAGAELSGHIAKLGEGVRGFRAGDRVAAFVEDAGAFAEFCRVPSDRLVRLPDRIDLATGASFPVQSLTAWHLLHTAAETVRGEAVLVHAIGGGVGLQLTQLAVAAGARVFGTVGTSGKEEAALLFGAERVFDRTREDFVSGLREALGSPSLAKVFDSVGATVLDESFGLLRRMGHVVSYGEAEGRPLPNLWERLVTQSLTFTRFHLGHVDFGSRQWAAGLDAVVPMIADGRLKVPIARVAAWEDAADLYDELGSRTVSGKLVLSIGAGRDEYRPAAAEA